MAAYRERQPTHDVLLGRGQFVCALACAAALAELVLPGLRAFGSTALLSALETLAPLLVTTASLFAWVFSVRSAYALAFPSGALSEERTAQRVFAIADRFDDSIAALRRDNAKLRRELVPVLRAGVSDDATVNRYVDQFLANRGRIQQLEDQRRQEIRRVLPAAQFARLVLAMPIVKMQVRHEMLSALRPHGAEPAGPGPASWEDDSLDDE